MVFGKKKQDTPVAPPIVFEPGGNCDSIRKKANLDQASQSPGFIIAQFLLADAIIKRASQIVLDCTRDAVAVRMQVDTVWHNLQPHPRDAGDALVAVLKKICDLSPEERRAKQSSKFTTMFEKKTKRTFEITSEGVPTGERVTVIVKGGEPKLENLEECGMRDKMRERWKELINAESGFLLLCAPPQGGLSTLYRTAMSAADRFLRDYVAVENQDNKWADIINVQQVFYNGAAGETPTTILPGVMLKQPHVVFAPDLVNGETVDTLTSLTLTESKLTGGCIRAKEAVEALLRVMMLKPNIQQFAHAVTAVLNVRLCRRLCEKCKQAYQPPPPLLQKLGIPPGRVQAFYREYQPPPPPPPESKEPYMPPPPCRECGAICFRGVLGIYELLEVNDALREALIKQPKLEVLRQVAKQSGHRNLQDEAILQICTGTTSLNEVQRILKA